MSDHVWRHGPSGLGSELVWCKTCDWVFRVMPDGGGAVGYRMNDGRQAIEYPPGPCGGTGTGVRRVKPPFFEESERQGDGG